MPNGICSVEDCTQAARRREWCIKHYQRWRMHGDPTVTLYVRPPVGTLCSVVDCNEPFRCKNLCRLHYHRMRIPDHPDATKRGAIMEHRVVMEGVLGRRLRRDEEVHHLNGVRDDNRPENLELWSISQPMGQRVVDKVAWALEILDLYAPEELAMPRERDAATA